MYETKERRMIKYLKTNKLFYISLLCLMIPVSYFSLYYLFSYSVYFKMSLELSLIISFSMPIILMFFGWWCHKFITKYKINRIIVNALIIIFVVKYMLNMFWPWYNLKLMNGIPWPSDDWYILYHLICLLLSLFPLFIVITCFWCGKKICICNEKIETSYKYNKTNFNRNITIEWILIFLIIIFSFVPHIITDLSQLIYNNITLSNYSETKRADEIPISEDISKIPESEFNKVESFPTSVEVKIKKNNNYKAYIEIYKNYNDTPVVAKEINKESEATFYVQKMLKIVTSKPDYFEVYVCGKKLDFLDENDTGVFTCVINFEDYRKEWTKRNNEIVERYNNRGR